MQTTVYCFLKVEGLHNWPECPHDEVSYLRDLHRHMFHIKAFVNVTHADRDVEFIILQHRIREYLLGKYGYGSQAGCFGTNICVFGSMSCEMIAEELISEFNLVKCDVSEDGENGAIVEIS